MAKTPEVRAAQHIARPTFRPTEVMAGTDPMQRWTTCRSRLRSTWPLH